MTLTDFMDATVHEAWVRGIEADDCGDVEEAYVALRLVCDLLPDSEMACKRFGTLCLTSGRQAEALAVFEGMCRFAPESADAWALLAFTLGVMGEYEAAMISYRRSLRCASPDAAHYLNLGALCYGAGLFVEAEEVYQEALKLWPSFPGAHFRLGLVRERLGNHVGAVASFKIAAQLDEKWFEAHFRLGQACEEIECYGEAFDAYSRAVGLAPLCIIARERLIVVCGLLGQQALADVHGSVLLLLEPSRVLTTVLSRAA